MKTKGLRNLAFIGFTALFLVSCQEEEFYKKEFIETYEDQYNKENPEDPTVTPDQGGSTDGGATDGGSTDSGSTDGGTTDGGSTDGGATDGGSTDGGSTDGGTTDGGSTDGGTTDGGSTDGGSTDGGSTDGGSTDGGSTDGGTTDGGSTDGGSTDGGSTDGGSTDGGSTDGGSTDGGGTDGGVTYIDVKDSFSQNAAPNQVDILWVIDNSGSMKEEQDALDYNFDVFIKDFVDKGIDFQMGIVTTDTTKSNWQKNINESLQVLDSQHLQQDKNKFMDDFGRLIHVGTNGNMVEKGLKASEVFTNTIFNNGLAPHHFRDDSYYAVVYVSDEEDQSSKLPEEHIAQLQKWKTNAGLVKAYSIVNISRPYQAGGYYTPGYERYAKASEVTGGKVADINEDFYYLLSDLGSEIAGLTDKYPLSQKPVDTGAIKVFVDGVEWSSGWAYSESSNTVKFSVVPAVGSSIEIRYQAQQ